MPLGGARPNSGRPALFKYKIKGVEYKSAVAAAKALGITRQAIYSACDNPRQKDWQKIQVSSKNPKITKPSKKIPKEIEEDAEKAGKTPMQFLDDIMNCEWNEHMNLTPEEWLKTRMTAAFWLLPYAHPKALVNKSKRQEAEEAAKNAGKGRFAPSQPPKLKAVK